MKRRIIITGLIVGLFGSIVGMLLAIGFNSMFKTMIAGYYTLYDSLGNSTDSEDASNKDFIFIKPEDKNTDVKPPKEEIDNSDENKDTGFAYFANFENLGKQTGGWVVITSQFGWRELWGRRDFHRGMDLRTGYGTDDGSGKKGQYIMYTVADNAKILSCETYETEKWGRGTNLYYQFERNGVSYRIRYCHLEGFLIDGLKAGDIIETKGTPIAVSGNTGSDTTGYHIHVDLQVSVNGKDWMWVHPMILYGYDNTREWLADNKIMVSHTVQCTDEYIEYNLHPELRTDIADGATGKTESIVVHKCINCYKG